MSKSGGVASTAYSVYSPTNGLLADFENLFQSFEILKSVRYTHFIQIWKQFQMSCVNAGRQTDQECREFTEESLKLALAYCLDQSLQAKVFGLYLLYGLYFKYPFIPRVKIRVTPSDWEELMNLLGEIKKQEHLDAEFVFLKLRYDRAFQFVATRNECLPVRSSNHDSTTDTQQQKLEMLITQKSIISEIFESDAIDQLAAIHEEYNRVKCALAGPIATKPSPELNVIEDGLIHMLTKSVTSHEEWRKTRIGKKMGIRRRRDSGGHTTSESEGDSEIEQDVARSKSHGSLRAEIKERAFSSAGATIGSRRFRKPVVQTDAFDESPTKRSRSSTAHQAHGLQFISELFQPDDDVNRGSDEERCVASMPCLIDENDHKRKGYKKKMLGGLNVNRAKKTQVKRRGRPKSNIVMQEDNVVNPDEQIGNAVGKVIKRKRRLKRDTLTGENAAETPHADVFINDDAAETSYASPDAKPRISEVVSKSAKKKKKCEKLFDATGDASPTKLPDKATKKKGKCEQLFDATGDASPTKLPDKATKKKGKCEKLFDTTGDASPTRVPVKATKKRVKVKHEQLVDVNDEGNQDDVNHLESDNLQELDVTVDEDGTVHVHLQGPSTCASSSVLVKSAAKNDGAAVEPVSASGKPVPKKRRRSEKDQSDSSERIEMDVVYPAKKPGKRPKIHDHDW